MSHCQFDYYHLLPHKPGILLPEATFTKSCRRWGASFTTKSRVRKRCDVCQRIAAYEQQQKSSARNRARRAANWASGDQPAASTLT
jgi:hypothetical protein